MAAGNRCMSTPSFASVLRTGLSTPWIRSARGELKHSESLRRCTRRARPRFGEKPRKPAVFHAFPGCNCRPFSVMFSYRRMGGNWLILSGLHVFAQGP